MAKDISMRDYIEGVGRTKIAEQLNVRPETIHYWLNYINAPKPHTAYRLIMLSNGLLTWEKIYQPFVDNNIAEQTAFDFTSNK